MKCLFLFFLTIFCFSCSSKIKVTEKELTANEVMRKTLLKLRKEKNLIPFGTGGRMHYEIKILKLAFNYYDIVDVPKGRELLTYSVNRFVEEINADKSIRKYLYNYPFQPQNVEIRIFIENKNKTDSSADELGIVTFVDGLLQYKIWHEESKSCTIILTETYEEAVEKLKLSHAEFSSACDLKCEPVNL